MKNIARLLARATCWVVPVLAFLFTPTALADTAWSGSGTESDPFVIFNVAELQELATSVNGGNAYAGTYFALGADITLTENWTPIGNGSRAGSSFSGNAFSGVFDGTGFEIRGLAISAGEENSAIGLFGVVNGGTVKNLKLADVSINATSNENAGGAIGLMVNGSTADHITVSGSVTAMRGNGGIVGRMTKSGTISFCINNATVSGSAANVGGIVGAAYYTEIGKEMVISNCKNHGTVTGGASNVGGITGLSSARISSCENDARISSGNYGVAGIVGEQQNYGSVIGCKNSGAVVCSAGYGAGGIVGWVRYSGTQSNYPLHAIISVTDNTNSASISGGTSAGGIVGHAYHSAVVRGNVNTAPTISAVTFAAGIVGSYQNSGETKLPAIATTYLTVTGNVSTTKLANISGSCKSLYVYDNTTGADGVTIADNTDTLPVAEVGGQPCATVEAAVSAAVTAAGENGTAEIKVSASASANATITEFVSAVANASANISLTVPTANGTVSFNKAAVAGIKTKAAGAAVAVSVEETTVPEGVTVSENANVYDISLTGADVSENFSVSDSSAAATITLPIPAGITKPVVYYIANAVKTFVKSTVADGTVSFTTSHLSTYSVEGSMTYAEFHTAVCDACKPGGVGKYDGNGVTVVMDPTVDTPNQENKGQAQYYSFKELVNVDVSFVNFVYRTAEEGSTFKPASNTEYFTTAKDSVPNAQLYCQNNGTMKFSNCSFDRVVLTHWGDNESNVESSIVDHCVFRNIYNAYAIKDIRGGTITITNCDIQDCGAGIMLSQKTADCEVSSVTITGNRFTNVDVEGDWVASGKGGSRGLVLVASSGNYTGATLTMTDNTIENCGPVFRQLNATAKTISLKTDLANLTYTSDTVEKENEFVTTSSSVAMVTANGMTTGYDSLQAALNAAAAIETQGNEVVTVNVSTGTFDPVRIPRASTLNIIGAVDAQGNPATTILAKSGTSTATDWMCGTGTIQNIRFETEQGYNGDWRGALRFHDENNGYSAHVTMTNCEFIGQGIHFIGAVNFIDCYFDGKGYAAAAINNGCPKTGEEVLIENCTFTDYNTSTMLHFGDNEGGIITVRGCLLNAEEGGIPLSGNVQRITFVDNDIACGYIACYGADVECVFDGNTFWTDSDGDIITCIYGYGGDNTIDKGNNVTDDDESMGLDDCLLFWRNYVPAAVKITSEDGMRFYDSLSAAVAAAEADATLTLCAEITADSYGVSGFADMADKNLSIDVGTYATEALVGILADNGYTLTENANRTYGVQEASDWMGAGAEADPYQIATVDDLKKLATKVNGGNAYAGKYFKVMADITLPNENWTPIGTSANPFSGHFDGDGRTISGLRYAVTAAKTGDYVYGGLFGSVKGVANSAVTAVISDVWVNDSLDETKIGAENYTASIKNLTLADAQLDTNGGYVGAVIGAVANAYVENVKVVSGHSYNAKNSGGVIGYVEGSVLKKVETASDYQVGTGEAYNYNIGGIVGTLRTASSVLIDCVNRASVTATITMGGIGGIVGQVSGNNPNVFSGCRNEGAITLTAETAAYVSGNLSGPVAGGLVGQGTPRGVFANCVNTGAISGGTAEKKVACLSGIANYMDGVFYHCQNTGAITGYAVLAGGIIANGTNNAGGSVFDGCVSLGVIDNRYEGGLVSDISPSTVSSEKATPVYKNMTFPDLAAFKRALPCDSNSRVTMENVTVTDTAGVLVIPQCILKFEADSKLADKIEIDHSCVFNLNVDNADNWEVQIAKGTTIDGALRVSGSNIHVVNYGEVLGGVSLTQANKSVLDNYGIIRHHVELSGTNSVLNNYGTIVSDGTTQYLFGFAGTGNVFNNYGTATQSKLDYCMSIMNFTDFTLNNHSTGVINYPGRNGREYIAFAYGPRPKTDGELSVFYLNNAGCLVHNGEIETSPGVVCNLSRFVMSTSVPVAMIGSVGYATLNAALDAVQNGETVKLLADVKLDATINFDKAITFTLDGNGHSISPVDENTSFNTHAIRLGIDDGAKIAAAYTVKNVTFKDFRMFHGSDGAMVLRLSCVENIKLENVTLDNCNVAGADKISSQSNSIIRVYKVDFEADGLAISNCVAGVIVDFGAASGAYAAETVIANSVFKDNIAYGTAVVMENQDLDDASFTLTNTKFQNNVIGDSTAAEPSGRAPLYIKAASTITDCEFDGNTVYGIHKRDVASGITVKERDEGIKTTSAIITDCVFTDGKVYHTNAETSGVAGVAVAVEGVVTLTGTKTRLDGNNLYHRETAANEYAEPEARSVGAYGDQAVIKAGTYSGALVTIGTGNFIAVSGGKFNQQVPEAYCADGFEPTTQADANGMWTVEPLKLLPLTILKGTPTLIAMPFGDGTVKVDWTEVLDKANLVGQANSTLAPTVKVPTADGYACYYLNEESQWVSQANETTAATTVDTGDAIWLTIPKSEGSSDVESVKMNLVRRDLPVTEPDVTIKTGVNLVSFPTTADVTNINAFDWTQTGVTPTHQDRIETVNPVNGEVRIYYYSKYTKKWVDPHLSPDDNEKDTTKAIVKGQGFSFVHYGDETLKLPKTR